MYGYQGLVFKEKSVARKEGHPPRQLFREQLHEEKVETFAQANAALTQSLIRELKQLRRRPQRRLQKNNKFNDQNNSSARASRFFK